MNEKATTLEYGSEAYFRGITRTENARSRQALNKLLEEFLVLQSQEGAFQETFSHLKKEVNESPTHEKAVRERVIASLIDALPPFAEKMRHLQKFVAVVLEKNTGPISKEVLKDIEKAKIDHKIVFRENHESHLWSNVQLEVSDNNQEGAHRMLLRLCESLRDTDKIWSELLELGDISPEIRDNFDVIVENFRLQDIVKKLDASEEIKKLPKEQQKIVRAQILSDFFSTGIVKELFDESFLMDVVDGKYSEDDPYLYGEITASFLSFEEEIDKLKKKKGERSRVRNLILAALIATTVGLGVVHFKDELSGESHSAQDTTQSISGDEFLKDHPVSPPAPDTKSTDTSPEGGGYDTTAPPTEGTSDQVENAGQLPEGDVWNVEGNLPNAYLLTNTSSQFFSNPEWLHNQGGEDYINYIGESAQNGTKLTFGDGSETPVAKLTSVFQIQSGYVTLPMSMKYRLASIDLGIDPSKYTVFRGADGTFELHIYGKIDAPVKITYDIVKDNSAETAPTNEDLNDKWLLGDVKQLPQEVQDFLNNVKKSTLSAADKAEKIRAYLQNSSVYSLQKKYTDYYKGNPAAGEFVRRFLELRHGDCIVVATPEIAFLRYVGVPARLGTGYLYSHPFLGMGKNALEAYESHGFPIFWNDQTQQWEVSDPTPTTLDEDAMEQLSKILGHSGLNLQDIFSQLRVSSLSELLQDVGLDILGLRDLFTNNIDSLKLLVLFATWIASLSFSTYKERKQTKKIEQWREDARRGLRDRPENFGWQGFLNKLYDDMGYHKNAIDRAAGTQIITRLLWAATSVPTWKAVRSQGRRVREIETNLATQRGQDKALDTSLIRGANGPDDGNDAIFEYLTKNLGFSPEFAKRELVAKNVAEMESVMEKQYLSAFSKSVMPYLDRKYERNLDVPPLAQLYAEYFREPKRSEREEEAQTEFCYFVAQRAYKEYLDDWRRQRKHELVVMKEESRQESPLPFFIRKIFEGEQFSTQLKPKLSRDEFFAQLEKNDFFQPIFTFWDFQHQKEKVRA